MATITNGARCGIFGIDEQFISGNASDSEKFQKWAETVPYTLRNPLFHWTHLELKKFFRIKEYLSGKNAEKFTARCRMLYSNPDLRHNLLKNYEVEALCTTDDPADNLDYHKELKASNFNTTVLPSFRPDVYINIIDPQSYILNIKKLEKASGININSVSDLLNALESESIILMRLAQKFQTTASNIFRTRPGGIRI
jgi:glucuronate isomerase